MENQLCNALSTSESSLDKVMSDASTVGGPLAEALSLLRAEIQALKQDHSVEIQALKQDLGGLKERVRMLELQRPLTSEPTVSTTTLREALKYWHTVQEQSLYEKNLSGS